MATKEQYNLAKEHIKATLNLRDIITHYIGIEVGKRNISCMFHDDKKPSMSVSDKVYYCFSCGAGGDIIDFVMRYFNLTFYEAIKKIDADFSLNKLGERITVKQQVKTRKSRLQELLEEAEKKKAREEEDYYFWEHRVLHNILASGELEPFSDEWVYAKNRIIELQQYIG